jgi:hypothetical protein
MLKYYYKGGNTLNLNCYIISGISYIIHTWVIYEYLKM